MTLPWQPLLTTTRSGEPELTLYGTLSLCHGDDVLVSVGETSAPLWSRSLLKPWQLLVCLPTLIKAYPELRPEHIALMMASHNGEPQHLALLEELMTLGDLNETHLQCPACAPMAETEQTPHREHSPLFHPCSGKHVGQLLTLKAQGQDFTPYLSEESPLYQALETFLKETLSGTLPTLAPTVDGCGMANRALTTDILARLYRSLATESQQSDLKTLQHAIQSAPEVLGGSDRIDTRLIQGLWTGVNGPKIYAKEGADGLLGVGISPTERYPNGLGLCIKLASGYNSEHLEKVARTVLAQLGLLTAPLTPLSTPLARQAHFTIPTALEVPA